MKVYITIKIDYFNDRDGVRTERYSLDRKWGENTCLGGFFRDDFDWTQCQNNKKCYFGRNILDKAITAFVVVLK